MSTLKVINLQHPSSTNNNVVLDSTGNITINGGTINPFMGMKNRIINGAMLIDQRNSGAAQTITAAAALAYTVDRWYAYCTGANVTGQRVSSTGTTAEPSQYAYRFTGAASVTAIGFGQRIESHNCYDLAGSTATLSVNLSNSLLTTVTWTAYYANTADTFGTLASPTRTQIATGTFTVNSTLTRYSTQISIPAAATTGIEIVFSVGAQTSGTWVIGNVQLEEGNASTTFERRQITTEVALAQRYCQWLPFSLGFSSAGAGSFMNNSVPFKVTMRAVPTISSISADPDAAQTSSLNATNSFNANYTTLISAMAGMTSSGTGNCFVYGYRALATSEL